MELTDEQKKIAGYDLKPGEILKVVAFAGSGKTSTLAAYAKARPQSRFLYVAFNKSVQMEAEAKFPSNVTCKTAHALAFPKFGAPCKDRLVPGYKANTIMKALGLDDYETAKCVIDTLLRYLVSSDPKIASRHIPPRALEILRQLGRTSDLVGHAVRLWDLMLSGEDSEVGMLHDGYLKLYQLSAPALSYDVILMDEAQDINPVTADFLLNQQGAAKVIVGDSHQQIYSFRGAFDFIQFVAAKETLYLTQSFRFTPTIAAAATMLLRYFKGEKRKIVGLNKQAPAEEVSGGRTIIARTNARVFDEAVRLLRKKKRIGFVGPLSGYRFDRIVDAYYLYDEYVQQITDPFIRSFPDFQAMESYARSAEDYEIAGICKVVREYRSKIPALVDQIKKAVSDRPEVILTTAHKSKGLEWDVIQLADDYAGIVDGDKLISPAKVHPDEINLIYVALTRGRQKVVPFPDFRIFAEKFYALARGGVARQAGGA